MQQAPAVERGRLLVEKYHCGSCHTVPGVPAARGTLAVPLAGFGRRSYIAGRVPNEPAHLARWIAEPAAIVPGTTMPDMGVSAVDARDIAAYLGQLR
ncbi:MAG TPA: c-type cytochrome [Burkholderiaceae bacterium]